MESITPPTPTPTLRQILLSRASLFQALIFGPIFIWLFIEATMQLYSTYLPVYDFIYDLFQAIFAGGIVFIVLVQRQLPIGSLDPRKAFYFELAKSLFATAAWLWLLLDAIFGPQSHRGWQVDRGRRIAATGLSVILLLYVTLLNPHQGPGLSADIRDAASSSIRPSTPPRLERAGASQRRAVRSEMPTASRSSLVHHDADLVTSTICNNLRSREWWEVIRCDAPSIRCRAASRRLNVSGAYLESGESDISDVRTWQ
jgi:hypothetical protein